MHYSDELEILIQKLEIHPLVQRVHFVKSPGVPESRIEEFCNLLGFYPEKNLLEFYRSINGFTLGVTFDAQEIRAQREKITDYPLDYIQDDANPYLGIAIISMEELFGNRYFHFPEKDPVEFNHKNYSLDDLSAMIKPFDKYSEFACFGIFIEQFGKYTRFLMLDGHYDSWFSSRLTSFEVYFKFLMKTGGISEARRKYFYRSEGHNQPPVLTTQFIDDVEIPDFFKNF